MKILEFDLQEERWVAESPAPPVLAVENTEPRGPSNLEIVGWVLLGTLFTSGLLGLLVWWVGTW